MVEWERGRYAPYLRVHCPRASTETGGGGEGMRRIFRQGVVFNTEQVKEKNRCQWN